MAETYSPRLDADANTENVEVFRNNRGGVDVDAQAVTRVGSDGTPREGSTAAAAQLPIDLNGTSWIKVLDVPYVGFEIQNDSDVDMFYVRCTTQPANGANFGIRLRKGASLYGVPPDESRYAGPIWARAESGATKSLRRSSW